MSSLSAAAAQKRIKKNLKNSEKVLDRNERVVYTKQAVAEKHSGTLKTS